MSITYAQGAALRSWRRGATVVPSSAGRPGWTRGIGVGVPGGSRVMDHADGFPAGGASSGLHVYGAVRAGV